MAVECPNCRTVLIGEVNRCWSCGAVIPAELLAELAPGDSGAGEEPQETEARLESSSAGLLVAQRKSASGDASAPASIDPVSSSPFADPLTGKFHSTATPTSYPSNLANVAGAIVSVVLGMAALLEARWFPLGGICTAIVGLLCGLWGVQSNRRVSSTIGMVMCTIALLWSGTNLAIDIYVQRTGNNPFAPNAPVDAERDDDLEF